MIRCYLGLGSNLKSPERQLRKALKKLKTLPKTHLVDTAPLYRNPAWGRRGMPDYVNSVAAIQTQLSPHKLLRCCHHIEKKQGRVRKIKYHSRTLDVDILQFGTRRIQSKTLTIPHPKMNERDFVQIPLRYFNHGSD
jgi:2-amino-4-hydroxy-6-hydroxymethyldihydropteridine diphosphokinase